MRRLTQTIAICLAAGSMAVPCQGAGIVRWERDVEAAFHQARATNRPVLLHFFTSECVPCQRLEQTVFNQPQVAAAMNDFFIPVKVDANGRPDLAARYGVRSVPHDVIVTPGDQELHRMHSPPDPDQYVAQLSAVAFRAGTAKAPSRGAQSPSDLASAPASGEPGGRYARDDHSFDTGYRGKSIFEREQTPIGSQAYGYSNDHRDPAVATSANEPREVINRYASRGQNDVHRGALRSGRPADNSSAPQDDSRWGAWPHQAVDGRPAAARHDPSRFAAEQQGQRDAATDRYAENHPAASRYGGPLQHDPGEHRFSPVAARSAPGSDTPSLSVRGRSGRGQPPRAQSDRPLGLDGYCPVSLVRNNSWTKGDARYGVIHRGRTYLFAGPEEKEIFFADPDVYSPVLGGIDPVELAANGQPVLGQRAHGVVYRKRVYLFSSEANLQQFWDAPERYASPIRQAMETGDVGRLFR